MTTDRQMIELQDVRFAYGGGDETLKDISFELGGGHCLALMGNNGAGKSTLLRCLNKILAPKGGRITVCGRELAAMRRGEVARTMAYVEQHNSAARFTVFDAVLLGRRPYIRMEPTAHDLEVVKNAILRLGLEELELRQIDELSGGELQKVVIARALAQEPQVLLLDEPTSNLDIYNQHEVMKLVREIAVKDGILVVVVIHDLNLAVQHCDRFLFIKDGRVFRFGDRSILTAETISQVYNVKARVVEVGGHTVVLVDT